MQTGLPAWKPFTKANNTTNFVIRDGQIVVWSKNKIHTIDLWNGASSELIKDVKFKGDERPSYMLLRHDGYFLRSSNNLALISFEGERVFHTYHKAPGFSFAEKMAGQLVQSVAEDISGELFRAGWTYDRAELHRQFDEWAPAAYLSDEDFDEYIDEKRFKATTNLETYAYILTNLKTSDEKGVGLVKVNKFTGETEDQIILGTKKPVYDVDEIEARLFFQSGKKEIVCYSF